MKRGATKAAPAKHRGRGRWRRWSPFLVGLAGLGLAGVVVGLVLLLRSGGNSSGPQSQQASVAGSEFRIVAYQGDDQLGGHDTQFSRVTRQGKPVVLNFFAGQCPPCRAEMPGFQRVADDFQGKAIFVGLDVGPYVQLGSHQDAQNLLRELHIRYAAGYAVDPNPLTTYQVQAMPTTIIFDASGQQVFKASGIMTESQLRTQLAKLTSR